MSHPVDYFERDFVISPPSRTGSLDLSWYDPTPLLRNGLVCLCLVNNALKRS